MKILFAQRALEDYRGSELFTFDLARALVWRGHDVCVWTPKRGAVAQLFAPNGIAVCEDLAQLPFQPDVIHGHQHLPTMAALANLPEVPAIHVWHGARPWVEQVPVSERIQFHAVCSDPMRQTLRTRADIDAEKVVQISNFVDTARFDRQRTGSGLKKALLYGQDGFSQDDLGQLQEACVHAGLSFDVIGHGYGNGVENPELVLPDYDLVFAVGRSALEAMACGCAVIPVVPGLAGTLIVPETLDHWSDLNFSPRYFRTAQHVSPGWLQEQIAGYSAEKNAQTTARIRKDWSLENAGRHYEALYERAVSKVGSALPTESFGPYMAWLAKEADALVWARAQAEAETRQLRQDLSLARDTAKAAEARVRHLLETLLLVQGGRVAADPEGASAYDVIQASGLFDAQWYLRSYPEVAEAGLDPLQHYLEWGVGEGRQPSPGFDEAAFHEANPHLQGLGLCALEHLARQMAHAGRQTATGSQGGAGPFHASEDSRMHAENELPAELASGR